MASPRSVSSKQPVGRRRYRRSSFNGDRRLQASGAKSRRMLALIGLLVLALLAALVVVAVHLANAGPAAPAR